MKYCSLDLETWRLAPRNPEGIAMLSMVVEDTEHPEIPTKELPHYTVIIEPQQGIVEKGSLTALAMNSWLMIAIEMAKSKDHNFIKKYTNLGIPAETLERARSAVQDKKYPVVTWEQALHGALVFLTEHFGTKDKITLAGKNVMGFDYHFLGTELQSRFRYSGADPGSMFWNTRTDRQLPGTEQVMQRAGVEYSNGHDARADACMIIEAIRRDPKIELQRRLDAAVRILNGYVSTEYLIEKGVIDPSKSK